MRDDELKACLCCGGESLIRGVRAVTKEGVGGPLGNMELNTYERPGAAFFKGRHSSPVSAVVRKFCGFVHYYATMPSVLEIPDN